MTSTVRTLILWIAIFVVVIVLWNTFQAGRVQRHQLSFTEFLQEVENQRVAEVTIRGQEVTGKFKEGDQYAQDEQFTTFAPDYPDLVSELIESGVAIQAEERKENPLLQFLFAWAPFLLIIGLWIFFMRQMQSGGNKALSFGKSRAKLLTASGKKVTFKDVAGIEEAKEELSEIVEFLRDPQKFQRLGGKIPKGVLMVGPPGTGKTLLARAIAGEAKVPFFTISGSDFVEMFVGVGASRVRDMFDQAKKQAPCIIFIDELDAVGRHRGAGLGGGHDEREQTLNQMLVEMDGFEGSEGIIVIAATNRPDVLDPALLRPGRFDRQVVVPLPDVRGRELILKVHMRKVPLSEDVNPSIIARGTPGFSGADLANLVNEAALFAARANKRVVSMDEFEKAKDKIMMGAERRSMVMSEKEKLNTAYHEAGHAIVGYLVPEHDPVYKVTIIPRGRALGVTMYLPEEDRYSMSKQRLESSISSLFGGRIAEEMINGANGVTTGASNDIERATEIARNMVTKWGLSDKLGPLTYSEDDGEVFLGRSVTQHKQVSDDTAHAIDEEVRRIVDNNYARAKKILEDNVDKLYVMAKALIKYETIDERQIKDIMNGREPRPPEDWEDTVGEDSSGSATAESDATGKIGGPAVEN